VLTGQHWLFKRPFLGQLLDPDIWSGNVILFTPKSEQEFYVLNHIFMYRIIIN